MSRSLSFPGALGRAVDLGLQLDRATGEGRVRRVAGLSVEVDGLRGAVGDGCRVLVGQQVVPAEIVGFDGEGAVVMPYGSLRGVRPGDLVLSTGEPLSVPIGPAVLGRVLDPLGAPLDGKPEPSGPRGPVDGAAPSPLARAPIQTPFVTGVRVIDGLLTLGRGQRIGVFAGAGVGKSTLLGQLARGASADVNVIALIGERGREVGEFLLDVLGPAGMAKTVVVVATGDAPPMLRRLASHTAVRIAESFRDAGADVLFAMDSVTRFAAAVREIGLAAGEPPALRGYPPSLFAELPRLVERLGNSDRGSITGILTVLVEGDDLQEPVSDALRGHLDGHIVLDREIAARGRFPAVDVLQSISRLMTRVTPPRQRLAAGTLRAAMARFEEARDLVQVGAYKRGSDPALDRVIDAWPAIETFLAQDDTPSSLEQTQQMLVEIAESSTGTALPVDE